MTAWARLIEENHSELRTPLHIRQIQNIEISGEMEQVLVQLGSQYYIMGRKWSILSLHVNGFVNSHPLILFLYQLLRSATKLMPCRWTEDLELARPLTAAAYWHQNDQCTLPISRRRDVSWRLLPILQYNVLYYLQSSNYWTERENRNSQNWIPVPLRSATLAFPKLLHEWSGHGCGHPRQKQGRLIHRPDFHPTNIIFWR